MKKQLELEVRIEPYTSSMQYYCIYYRWKKKINLFNTWRLLIQVWNGAYITYGHPVLFPNFDYAVEYGKTLKSNPKLIEEHYKKQDQIYEEALNKRNDYYDSRNKSTTL